MRSARPQARKDTVELSNSCVRSAWFCGRHPWLCWRCPAKCGALVVQRLWSMAGRQSGSIGSRGLRQRKKVLTIGVIASPSLDWRKSKRNFRLNSIDHQRAPSGLAWKPGPGLKPTKHLPKCAGRVQCLIWQSGFLACCSYSFCFAI